MIKAIMLDDGYHDRIVVINYGINYAKKVCVLLLMSYVRATRLIIR